MSIETISLTIFLGAGHFGFISPVAALPLEIR
jgi:hypothetical protein